MMTPTIPTERLSMSQLSRSTPDQIRWLNNPEVVRYSEQRHEQHTQYSQINYINCFKDGSHIWRITRLDTGMHIGNIAAIYDLHNKVADVGILIGDIEQWGHGFGAEAWGAVCNWLLGEGGVRKLEAGCMRSNAAMMKIINKSGFKFEGERVNHFLLAGSPVGAVLFGRFK